MPAESHPHPFILFEIDFNIVTCMSVITYVKKVNVLYKELRILIKFIIEFVVRLKKKNK